MRISDWSSDVCSSDLEATGTVTVTDRRAQAMADTGTWYQRLYGNDPELRQTRDNYAMKENTLPDPARRADLADFFFWTAWVAATERPDYHATYRSEEHTSELQSLMRISYAVFCLKKKKRPKTHRKEIAWSR